jgi:hypothetical protein
LFKGGAAILADSQNGDIIVLSVPTFTYILKNSVLGIPSARLKAPAVSKGASLQWCPEL